MLWKEDRIILSVKDDGVGIDPDKLEMIRHTLKGEAGEEAGDRSGRAALDS